MNVIDILEQTPNRVRGLIAGRSEEALSFKPAPDVFSLRENLLHLRDIDIEGYEGRIIRIVSERDPTFPDIDGARLARERNYNIQPVAPAWEAFAASRARSIARLRAITPENLERTGELEGVGRITLQEMLERWAQHDREHLAEMSRETGRNAGVSPAGPGGVLAAVVGVGATGTTEPRSGTIYVAQCVSAGKAGLQEDQPRSGDISGVGSPFDMPPLRG